jgi:hypothetical protein
MAKQKISFAGIAAIAVLVVFMLALSGGVFKNFAIQSNNSTNPTPTPSTTQSQNGNSIVQQFIAFLNWVWNQIKTFLGAHGFNLQVWK